jgi:hypothetical protein
VKPSTILLSAALLTGTAGVVVLVVPPDRSAVIPVTEPSFTVQFLPPDGILADPSTGTPVLKRVRIDWEALPSVFYSLDRLTDGLWVEMRQIDAGEGGFLSYQFNLCEDDQTNQWRVRVR